MSTDDRDVILELGSDGVALITLSRPQRRNALSRRLQQQLNQALLECERRDDVRAMVLTGAGDAFCAGVDLREVSSGQKDGVDPRASGNIANNNEKRGPFHGRTKVLIGAINGPAVTGGLELALNCDFLIASTKASFADTHARVGIMPGWGLTVLLPQWVGIPRARQMSVTGDYVLAEQALAWGLVNEVVPPDELLTRACKIAATSSAIKPPAVEHMLATYAATTGATPDAGWAVEQNFKRRFAESSNHEIGQRFEGIRSRGAGQQTAKL